MKISLVLFIISFCLTTQTMGQEIEEGVLNGAEFTIVLPDNWDGSGLVMYAHGYEETEKYSQLANEEFEQDEDGEFEEDEEDEGEFYEIFTKQGFAFAASEYRSRGLVIEEGTEDTEALRKYFVEKYGEPKVSIITGHSMGGMITIRTIEKYAESYQGALPLCGWPAPVYSLIKSGFDALVLFDYLFGDNTGKLVVGEELIPLGQIESNAEKGKKDLLRFAEHFRLKEEDVAGFIHFMQVVLKETSELRGGLPVSNLNTIYAGFGFQDSALNRNVLRYEASPVAQKQAIDFYTPTGEIKSPVYALHTTYDEILPVFGYEYYDQITAMKETDELYHQQYVVRDGHCAFTWQETQDAFDQLVNWIETGQKPVITYR